MAHIHTEPHQHDLTASAYIFRLDGSEPRIVLHYHLKLGGYMQFGGHVELDEHPWQAIAHEVHEESGYDLDQLQVLQPRERVRAIDGIVVLPHPVAVLSLPYGTIDHVHDDIAWAFVTHEAPRHAPASRESRAMRLLTKSQLESMEGEEVVTGAREMALAIFEICLPTWEPVSTDTFSGT